MTRTETKYDVAKQYRAGYVASLGLTSSRSLSESDHWIQGWDDGYCARHALNQRLDAYLTELGHGPMAVIRTAEGEVTHD